MKITQMQYDLLELIRVLPDNTMHLGSCATVEVDMDRYILNLLVQQFSQIYKML